MTIKFEPLLPCPFCGGEATLEEIPSPVGGVSFTVGCNSDEDGTCMSYQSLTTFSLRSDAIKAWNKRKGENKYGLTLLCQSDGGLVNDT